VPSLPPAIVSPTELPGLTPGDLVQFQIRAQGPVVATYRVGETEIERDAGPPYEVRLPADGIKKGDALVVRLESGDQASEATFAVHVQGEPADNTLLLLAAAAVGVSGLGGIGGFWAIGRMRARPRAIETADAPQRLTSWAQARIDAAGQAAARQPAPTPVVDVGEPGPWGALTVIAGAETGRRFELRGERELCGRGRFCSVRLKDKRVQDAHFVLTPDLLIFASTPDCPLSLNGDDVRQAQLQDGDRIRVGATELEFRQAGGAARAVAAGTPPHS